MNQADSYQALPSWPMQTPLWITHESPTVQLVSTTLYLEKHSSFVKCLLG